MSNFRYGPSLTNKIHQPVSTYYVVPFNSPDDPAQKQKLVDACKLPGYTRLTAGRRWPQRARGSVNLAYN